VALPERQGQVELGRRQGQRLVVGLQARDLPLAADVIIGGQATWNSG
jgi:hypothetical protein